MDLVLELEIPARPEFIAVVRLVVSAAAQGRPNLPEQRIDDLKLAVSEACTNAIEAHDAAATTDHVRIRVYEGAERFEVCVEDRGPGFDPEALPAHPPVTDPERLNFERGLGIPLIRTLVDDAEFWSSDQGTSVHLILHGDGAGPEPPDEALRLRFEGT